jgi:hypothetical protein
MEMNGLELNAFVTPSTYRDDIYQTEGKSYNTFSAYPLWRQTAPASLLVIRARD